MLRCEEIVDTNSDGLVNNNGWWGVAERSHQDESVSPPPILVLDVASPTDHTRDRDRASVDVEPGMAPRDRGRDADTAWPPWDSLGRDHRNQAPLRLHGRAHYSYRRPSPARPIPHRGERLAKWPGRRHDHSCKLQTCPPRTARAPGFPIPCRLPSP